MSFSSLRLPLEVIERIIGYVGDNYHTLHSFSRTCRDLRPLSFRLMIALGVRLKSRDRVFAFHDFLQVNPHFRPLVCSISTEPDYLIPIPLLRILPNLCEIQLSKPQKPTNQHSLSGFAPSRLRSYHRFGIHVQTLHLDSLHFPTLQEFTRLLLAFTRLQELAFRDLWLSNDVPENTAAHCERRLSKHLLLKALTVCTMGYLSYLET